MKKKVVKKAKKAMALIALLSVVASATLGYGSDEYVVKEGCTQNYLSSSPENVSSSSSEGIFPEEFWDNKIMGDVDLDGEVTSADSLLILRYSVQLDNPSTLQRFLSDVNPDTYITSVDALITLRCSVGFDDNHSADGLYTAVVAGRNTNEQNLARALRSIYADYRDIDPESYIPSSLDIQGLDAEYDENTPWYDRGYSPFVDGTYGEHKEELRYGPRHYVSKDDVSDIYKPYIRPFDWEAIRQDCINYGIWRGYTYSKEIQGLDDGSWSLTLDTADTDVAHHNDWSLEDAIMLRASCFADVEVCYGYSEIYSGYEHPWQMGFNIFVEPSWVMSMGRDYYEPGTPDDFAFYVVYG